MDKRLTFLMKYENKILFYFSFSSPNDKKSFCSIEGEWNGVMYAKWATGVSLFYISFFLCVFWWRVRIQLDNNSPVQFLLICPEELLTTKGKGFAINKHMNECVLCVFLGEHSVHRH